MNKATTTTPNEDLKALRGALNTIDGLSQDGLSQIATMARLALVALEHPQGHQIPELMFHTLRAIWGKAEDLENCINVEAERVGCNFVDESLRRIYAAHSRAKEGAHTMNTTPKAETPAHPTGRAA